MSSIDPSNNYVIDAESQTEMERLLLQDHLITQAMESHFPQDIDLYPIRSILDIACGPGGWALQAASMFPDVEIIGIDISKTMIEYANIQARSRRLDNVTFRVMDATQPLKFADNSFDFVNARFMVSFMSRAAWPVLVQEYTRLVRPGGTLRLTETDTAAVGITNSLALDQLMGLCAQAFYRAEKSFNPDPNGRQFAITPMIGQFMQNAGIPSPREQAHVLNYSFGTEAYHSSCKNHDILWTLFQPFLLKEKVATQEELDRLYIQMQIEMLQNNFRGLWYFLSVYGQKPA